MNPSSGSLYFFTFLLAFCSLFYELVYAQILSVCLGGTKIQYLTIIALFTFALGMGSITFGRVKLRYSTRRTFFVIECLLTVLGSAGPFLITWMLQPGGMPGLWGVKVFLSYFTIFFIGFLSGFEIPCLFAFGNADNKGKILAMDYIGMLTASVTFPLLFLPKIGTAPGALVIAACNCYALVWLRSDKPKLLTTIALTLLTTSAVIYILLNVKGLNDILSGLYLGGNP